MCVHAVCVCLFEYSVCGVKCNDSFLTDWSIRRVPGARQAILFSNLYNARGPSSLVKSLFRSL